MERIPTMDVYSELLRVHAAAGQTRFSSLYLPKQTLEKAIADGKAYFLPQQAGGGYTCY